MDMMDLDLYSFYAFYMHVFVYIYILFKTFRLIQVEISFKLKGIALQTIHARELPDCYAFQNTVSDYGVWHFQHCTYNKSLRAHRHHPCI